MHPCGCGAATTSGCSAMSRSTGSGHFGGCRPGTAGGAGIGSSGGPTHSRLPTADGWRASRSPCVPSARIPTPAFHRRRWQHRRLMFQPLPLSIGLRYLRAKRRNGFISFISMASILGIIIGVIALITTISVMTGFQQELRARILGMVAHATVTGLDGPVDNWPRAVELAG